MDQHRLVIVEEMGSFLQGTSRLEQLLAFVADHDVHPIAILLSNVLLDLIGQMMHVHHKTLITLCTQP